MGHRSRHAATWRTTKQPWVRHGGAWRQASAAWIRQGGTWVKWWPDLPDRGGPYLYGSIASAGPNIIRHDGSLWVAVGGGLSGGVRKAALADDGQLLTVGFTAAATSCGVNQWNGSAWVGVSNYFNQQNQSAAYDGSRFYYTRNNIGGPDAAIYLVGVGLLSTTGVSWFSGSGNFNRIAASQLHAGSGDFLLYGDGNWNSPVSPPSYFDTYGAYSLPVGIGFYAARQLDGLVWSGLSAVYKESGPHAWTQVGASSFAGGYVYAVCALPDGRAWAGGDFTTYNGAACTALAEWNGTAWVQIGSGLTYVAALAYHQDKLWILDGSAVAARKVYTWDGTTLALQSDWTGDSVYGLL